MFLIVLELSLKEQSICELQKSSQQRSEDIDDILYVAIMLCRAGCN